LTKTLDNLALIFEVLLVLDLVIAQLIQLDFDLFKDHIILTQQHRFRKAYLHPQKVVVATLATEEVQKNLLDFDHQFDL